jgi:hypothetical protein
MSRRKVRLLAGGTALLLLVASVIALLHWMGGPNTGTVQVGTPKENVSQHETQSVSVKTSYFTTVLPAGFVIKRQVETPASSALLQLVANTPSATDQQFAATVDTTPGGGIQEVGDYHLRASQTTIYTRFKLANLPTGAVAFKNSSGPAAFTVFWPHGSRYAELSLSTDGLASLDQLEATFSQVVTSWQWQ